MSIKLLYLRVTVSILADGFYKQRQIHWVKSAHHFLGVLLNVARKRQTKVANPRDAVIKLVDVLSLNLGVVHYQKLTKLALKVVQNSLTAFL